MIDAIRSRWAEGDRLAAKQAAHALKGVTGTLGLTALFEAASALDGLFREPAGDAPAVGAWLAKLDMAQQALDQALDGMAGA
jgi:HPt (histidine-containing phosphotransfer) domain-containing protein